MDVPQSGIFALGTPAHACQPDLALPIFGTLGSATCTWVSLALKRPKPETWPTSGGR